MKLKMFSFSPFITCRFGILVKELNLNLKLLFNRVKVRRCIKENKENKKNNLLR